MSVDTGAREPQPGTVSALSQRTAEMRARAEHALMAWGEPFRGDGNLRTFTTDLARDVIALLEELSGLREQLDAARQALLNAEAEAAHGQTASFAFVMQCVRAALGVVGPPPQTDGVVSAPDKERRDAQKKGRPEGRPS